MFLTVNEWKNAVPIGIIITIPKSTSWSEYRRELDAALDGAVMNYKMSSFPKVKIGDLCYVCHDGFVKGHMKISGMGEKEFTCTTTGNNWAGKFLERTGQFYHVKDVHPMKGFQGFRYVYSEFN